jgi:class 3 adenylate cyclase
VRRVREDLGIELRAGVHTGEVELVGPAVRGLAVHLAARITALAGPGEVLASSTVRDLVVGSGLAFGDRGEHELEGIPGRWRLFAAEAGSRGTGVRRCVCAGPPSGRLRGV